MNIYEIMLLFLLLALIVTGGIYFYYLVKCYLRVKEGKKIIFITPYWLFASEAFDESGNKYRVAALKTSVLAFFIAGALIIVNGYR